MIRATGKDLGLTEAETQFWFNRLSEYLAEESMLMHWYDANTWLLLVNKKPLHASPVYQMINQSLMPALAELDASMYWQKFFTECQMFFAAQNTHLMAKSSGSSAEHTHKPWERNDRADVTSEQAPLNGVWIWGGAELGAKKNDSICADSHLLSIAELCSNHVTLYNPSIQLKKFQIILLNDIDSLSRSHQEEIKKISAQWFWNNTAYTQSAPNWITRIWRTLIHAH
jgi:hypothetical protein